MVNSGFCHSPQSPLNPEWRAEEHQKALSQGSSCKGVDTQTQAKAVGRGVRHAEAVWVKSLRTAGDSLGWDSLWQPD